MACLNRALTRPALRFSVMPLMLLVVLMLLVAGCRIQVPVDPGENPPHSPSASPLPTALPTEGTGAAAGPAGLPPLPRADIVGNDMTFGRGGYIARADAIAFADAVSGAPGWTRKKLLVNGESVYAGGTGCTASLRQTPAQHPLVVDGDDKASTEALFRFVDSSILPEYLVTTSWLWGASPGESKASIDFLTYVQKAAGDTPASALSLRLFHATGTGLAVIVSCPTDETLAAAITDIRGDLSVIPPG